MLEQYTGIVVIEVNGQVNGQVANVWNGQCWTGAFAQHALLVSFAVALTLFAGSFLAKIVAVTLPLSVAALKKDPAVVAQPLLTTIIDVVSLLIYLAIATVAFSLL